LLKTTKNYKKTFTELANTYTLNYQAYPYNGVTWVALSNIIVCAIAPLAIIMCNIAYNIRARTVFIVPGII
jgi:hypothetical protein